MAFLGLDKPFGLRYHYFRNYWEEKEAYDTYSVVGNRIRFCLPGNNQCLEIKKTLHASGEFFYVDFVDRIMT